MGFDIPIGFIHRLPDSAEIRFTIRCAGRPISRSGGTLRPRDKDHLNYQDEASQTRQVKPFP